MASNENGMDRRRHPRVDLDRVVIGQTAVLDFVGAVKDISVSGIALDAKAQPLEGHAVTIDIQDLRKLSGTVKRTFDGGFVVTYDLDEAEADKLISDLMQISNNIQTEED